MNIDQVKIASDFFDVSQEDLLKYVSKGDSPLQKADGNKEKKSPGVVLPMKGFLESQWQVNSSRGLREQMPPIADNLLREIERKNPIISSIINTRCRQMRAFSRRVNDDRIPGWRIKIKDIQRTPTKAELKRIEEIEQFFTNTGRMDFDGWEEREDTIHDVMIKMAREFLTIDKVAIELRRNNRGDLLDFWLVDGATIKRVTRYGGYRGQRSDFDPRLYVSAQWLTEKLAQLKMDMVPKVDKIKFVQELDGHLIAAFEHKDLLFETMQSRVDIRYAGFGYSPTEQAIGVVTSFLFAMAYNSEVFNTGAIPKIGLSIEDGGFSDEQLQELQDEWIANFRGIGGMWRIPILNGKVNVVDFWKSPREMEYSKYLEFTGALICAVFGIDSSELGLRLQQATSVLSENINNKMEFSKDRALKDILGKQEDVFNKIVRICKWDDFTFHFCGLDPLDKDAEMRLMNLDVKSRKTLNEIRAENDLPKDPYGDIVLDPTYLQYRMMKEQAEQGEQQGGGEEGFDMGEEAGEDTGENADEEKGKNNSDFSDEELDSFSDEMADSVLGKASGKIKARTLLI